MVMATGSSSSNGVVVQPLKDDETWIEVSNKSNQTPSHWDYDNMISQEKVNEGSFELMMVLILGPISEAKNSEENST